MVRKTRKQKKRNSKRAEKVQIPNQEYGFDFGFQEHVSAITDMDFNKFLHKAGIIACAYGYNYIEGMSRSLPSLTLVGTNQSAIEEAYIHFRNWGCEDDGDVVAVSLLLRKSGGYDFWVGPDVERSMYRMIPQANIVEPIIFNASYIKHFNTTHETIHLMKEYCSLNMHPFVLSMAIGNLDNPSDLSLKEVPGWKDILKFNLEIVDERESPGDARFNAPKKSKLKKHQQPTLKPEQLCERRKKVFDCVFPVTRERIRRSSILREVQEIDGFSGVSETQVVQAVINLIISGEIASGVKYYQSYKGDIKRAIWDCVMRRIEVADGGGIECDISPLSVAHQIELDVRMALKSMKAKTGKKCFSDLQDIFRQVGYIDD